MNSSDLTPFTIAAVQDAPVFLDREATVEKACGLIADGKLVAGPLRQEQTILYAEVDPRKLTGPRWQLDVAGHYGRPDIFELTVHRKPRPMVRIVDEPGTGERDGAAGE